MAKKPETNVKELKPDLEESTTQFRSLLCNKEYHTGDFLETGFCSPICQFFSMHHHDNKISPVFRNAVEILYEFGSVLPDRLIFKDNFYVAVVFKEKVMATLIFKLHPTATTVCAEITLAATHPLHRRKGALRALMVQLEKVLKKLKVNKFILPSLPRSIYMAPKNWIRYSSFVGVDTFIEEHRSIEDFQGTILCYKVLFQLLLREKKKNNSI
ncbi:hypothetical protein QL285_074740 [Trifolium repens]|nr:hypothetical protein QL285_074740 [Trifolium repens]